MSEMDAERRKVAAIFAEALQVIDPVERMAFLDRACAGNQPLRQEVESLLRAHEQAGGFLSKTKTVRPGDLVVEKPGMMIGRYKLLEQIGEGGFGMVYMAEQVEPVHRKVALKIIKAGMDTKEVIARFEAERQALALMDHPNIARVLDAGATQAGRPYFVMELVRGIPITDYCDRHNLSTGERLELFIQICRAVQHAHQKGIIHRDLKPSNILVTTPDGAPVPKVIDFGIAKAIAQRLTDKTLFTGFAQFIGTPAYISPEQAEVTALDVDTRSDIYSLGVLLYELLTGQTPFDAERLVKAGMDAMRRIIREDEPPRPSTRLSTLAADALTEVARHRHVEPPRLIHSVRGDLDWIVMKCLEKDRRRRYEGANGLAMDVERYLRAEPVEAVPPSIGYRIQKLAVRHRKSLAVAAAVSAVLLTAILVTAASIGWVVRDRQAREAAFEQRVAVALEDARKAYLRDDLTEVRAAMRSAEALLATASPSQRVAAPVHQWRTDLDMVERLETIRENSLLAIIQSRSQVSGLGDDRAIARETDRAYREAFDQYALPIGKMSDQQAAERIRLSLIKAHLVKALDHWAAMKWIQDAEGSGRLLAIAEQSDHDPWRARVCEALRRGSDEELHELAGDPDLVNSAPLLIKLSAVVLDRSGERVQAIRLLRLALQSHPDDYWINFFLGHLLFETGRHEEGIAFGRAALALKPDAWYSHGNLARNLATAGTLRGKEEAEFHFREAIRLNPAQAHHYLLLANTLLRQQRDHGKVIDATEVDALFRAFLERVPSHYDRAAEQHPGDHWLWFQAAALHLYRGDVEAYRRCCVEMLDRFGRTEDVLIAERTAKTCLLMPDTVDNLQPARRLADFAVDGTEEHFGRPWFVMVRALADYRANHYAGAAEWLERCRPPGAVGTATIAAIRAMTLHELGRTEQARRSLADAQRLLSQRAFRNPGELPELYDWMRADILYQEAVALLGRPEDAATNPNED